MITINAYKFTATDKTDGTVRLEPYIAEGKHAGFGAGDPVVFNQDGTVAYYPGRTPKPEVMAEMAEALKYHLAGAGVRAAEAAQAEAAKLTLIVRNVGRNRDFGRAALFARAHDGKFDETDKTWTVRVTAAERADLLRLHSLKELEVLSHGKPVAPTYTLEEVIAEAVAAPVAEVAAEVAPAAPVVTVERTEAAYPGVVIRVRTGAHEFALDGVGGAMLESLSRYPAAPSNRDKPAYAAWSKQFCIDIDAARLASLEHFGADRDVIRRAEAQVRESQALRFI